MNFLLDTNICSAFLKGNGRVFDRFMQYSGGLAVSTIVIGELYSWVYRSKTKAEHLSGLVNLLSDLHVIPVDLAVAEKFGAVRAALLDQGRPTPEVDLFIASSALAYDLTLVTHNVSDFAHVPDLRLQDWLEG